MGRTHHLFSKFCTERRLYYFPLSIFKHTAYFREFICRTQPLKRGYSKSRCIIHFHRYSKLAFSEVFPNLRSHILCMRLPFCPHRYQWWVQYSFIWCQYITRYHDITWIGISFIMNEMEYLFMCLWTIIYLFSVMSIYIPCLFFSLNIKGFPHRRLLWLPMICMLSPLMNHSLFLSSWVFSSVQRNWLLPAFPWFFSSLIVFSLFWWKFIWT